MKLYFFLGFVLMFLSCNNGNENDYQLFDKLDDTTVLDKIKKNKNWFQIEPTIDTVFNSLDSNFEIDSSKATIRVYGDQLEFDSNGTFFLFKIVYRIIDDSLVYNGRGNDYREGVWKVSNGEINIEGCLSYSFKQTWIEESPCEGLIFGFRGDTLIVLDYDSFKNMKNNRRILRWYMYLPPKVKIRVKDPKQDLIKYQRVIIKSVESKKDKGTKLIHPIQPDSIH